MRWRNRVLIRDKWTNHGCINDNNMGVYDMSILIVGLITVVVLAVIFYDNSSRKSGDDVCECTGCENRRYHLREYGEHKQYNCTGS